MITTDKDFLRQVSTDCSLEESESIFEKLEIEIKKHDNALGLSAIQIGIPKRAFVMWEQNYHQNRDKKILHFLNPKIVELDEPIAESYESCFSLPEYYVKLKRYEQVTQEDEINGKSVLYQDESIIFQHEFDHLNGILIIDKKDRIVIRQPLENLNIERNKPCTCGSGKKAKRCCYKD